MQKTFNKILYLAVLVGILYSPISPVFKTKKAEALFGVGDVTFTFETNPVLVGAAGSQTSSFAKQLADFGLKIAGQLLKKLVLDRLVDAIITWVNNDGKGAIIDDWNKFFREAGEAAVGEVAKDIGLGFLCSPFNLQLQLMVVKPPKFSQQITCTLDTITGNINAFFNDFTNGDWIAYRELWAPQNNFYGATLLAMDETSRKEAEARAAAQAEGIAGQGFLSFKKCDSNGKNCRIVTPGRFVSEAATESLIKIPANSIIGADDIATYIAAIADAVINRFVLHGVGLAKTLSGELKPEEPSPETPYIPTDPCADLTGGALSACRDLQTQLENQFSDTKNTYLDEINLTLSPRQNASNELTQAITLEEKMIYYLNTLANCNNDTSLLERVKNTEQPLLNDLQKRFSDNDKITTSLEAAYTAIVRVPDNDWAALTTQYNNAKSSLNSSAANDFLTASENSNRSIITATDAEFPSLENQITQCVKPKTP